MFTCLVSRAIHCEVVPAIYTLPKILISDQGTNFVGANEILSTINKTTEVKQMCATKGIEWKLTPAKALWFGGVYERLIGLVKRELHKMCKQGCFSEFQFYCTIREIQGIINARPLVRLGRDEVLTPSHILHGFGPRPDFSLSS